MKPNSGRKRLLSLISAVSCSSLLILSPLAQRAQADDITDALEAVIEYTAQLHQINFKYLLSNGPITTPCGVISLAAFCTVDNTVYVNLKQQWNRGIGGIDEGGMSIGIELQADCLAGDTLSWLFTEARSLSKQDYIIAGKLLAEAASEVGDFEAPNNSHGTPQQRGDSVLQGFYGENHQACMR